MTQGRAAQPRPSRVVRWSDSRGRKEFHLLLATSRPAVHSFFVDLRRHASWPFVVARIPVDVDALGRHEDHLASATTAAVDVGLDQAGAIELCQELHRRRPDLPVAALACCPHSLTPWNFRALIAAGVSSVLDLQATSDEALRALQNVAGGGTVVHLQSLGGRRGLRDILSGGELKSRTQIELLELVARGLPDHEIGRRLHLSPHTVKHHIENVRNAVGVRNRTELAAWAGRNGFYAADDRRIAG
jgi:DNA-binding NarL/FixJ family response regulator